MCNPAVNYWPGKSSRPGENLTLTSREGAEYTVHVTRPEGEPPYPTVIILSDWFDPENYYVDLADQYAAAGYLGVCPDLFYRQGKLPAQTSEAAARRIAAVADNDVFADFDDTIEHLRAQGLIGDLAITGFCWGGRMAYLVAARHTEAKLLLPFYGHLAAMSGPDRNKPYSPLEEASKIESRVVGSYGGADESIPVEGVKEMERRLRAKGLNAELKIYAGAPHCFFRTPEWKEDSDDAWQRVLTALKETVG
jgi:carboxymethylenebutenolidase